jgi:hypothetical protein
VHAFQEPATLLSCLLAAALLAGAPRLLGIVRDWTAELASLPGVAAAWFEAFGLSSLTVPILVLPLLAAASLALGVACLRWID